MWRRPSLDDRAVMTPVWAKIHDPRLFPPGKVIESWIKNISGKFNKPAFMMIWQQPLKPIKLRSQLRPQKQTRVNPKMDLLF